MNLVSTEHLSDSNANNVTKHKITKNLNLNIKRKSAPRGNEAINIKSKMKCDNCGNHSHFTRKCTEPKKVQIYLKSLLNYFVSRHVIIAHFLLD